MVQYKAILAVANHEVECNLSIGTTFNDSERPLTHTSRSRQYSTLNMPLSVQDIDTYLSLQSITIKALNTPYSSV